MISLSKEQQEFAKQFIIKEARPLEKELYAHYISGSSTEGSERELAMFQNQDGGFGNGLEPDIRARCSSPYVTSEAMRTLRELGVPCTHPMVKGAVQYLLNSYDERAGVWPVAPPEANGSPHAPWMGYGEDVERHWHGFLANPRAAIIASLFHYSSLVPQVWLSQLLDSLNTYLVSRGGALDGYEFGAVGQLLDVEALPQETFRQLLTRFGNKLCVPPVPGSPLIGNFTDEQIEQDLDAIVKNQCPDGTWPITWSWEDADPHVWPTAQTEWKGIMTVVYMKKLKAFGRLE